jgi:hypothetical protein
MENSTIDSILHSHKDKIYPWVKVFFTRDDDPRITATQIDFKGDEAPIRKNWLGDLMINYVADMGDRFQVILERDLPRDITKENLHQLAIDNLNRDIKFNLHTTDFGGYMLIGGADHEAGSICLPNVWTWLADYFNDNLIVGIPAKDLVFLVPESDSNKISNLKIIVHETFKDGERLLTKNIFRFDREKKEWTIIDSVT